MDERQKAHPLLLTLVKVQRKYGKDYSWPSQEKIIELIHVRQGYKKSRATINRWLRVIDDGKYIIRRRRIKKNEPYGMVFKSTLYKITIKGYRLLSMFGVDVSGEIAAYQRWLEEINPGIKARRLKKESAAAQVNNNTPEGVRKIIVGLGKILAS